MTFLRRLLAKLRAWLHPPLPIPVISFADMPNPLAMTPAMDARLRQLAREVPTAFWLSMFAPAEVEKLAEAPRGVTHISYGGLTGLQIAERIHHHQRAAEMRYQQQVALLNPAPVPTTRVGGQYAGRPCVYVLDQFGRVLWRDDYFDVDNRVRADVP